MQDRKIILFEINEVPFRIIDEFCKWRPESALAKFLTQCRQYETWTDTEGEYLNPWTTWPTLHRGISDHAHRLHYFGQDLSGPDTEYPPLWKLLAPAGVKTGVFGSLHSYPLPDSFDGYAFFVPDTFAAGSECFPADLEAFQDFNLTMARMSGRNVSKQVAWQSALNFLAKMPQLGIKASTVADTGKQVISEKLNPTRTVRRRSYQAVLGFDVFMKQVNKTKPDFASFFSNHVASSMHRYWAAAFPADYETFTYTQEWVETYADEIDFAMSKFDEMFARVVRFVDRNPDYTLWVASSMGQAAGEAMAIETELNVTDPVQFMTGMGLHEGEWEKRAAMVPANAVFVNENKQVEFRERLKTLEIAGKKVTYEEREKGFFSILFGQYDVHKKEPFALLNGERVPLEKLGLTPVPIQDSTSRNGFHIQTGSLLVYDPKNRPNATEAAARPQIDSTEIAPAILHNFNIDAPTYMPNAAPIG
ncbi:MAG: hypothetical protein O3A46_13425 [Candidatus Poribacteria bacterium]|nr:hypothetical protein [Candidatus Poribacteria bacterium]